MNDNQNNEKTSGQKKSEHRKEALNHLNEINNRNSYNSINAIIIFRFICYLQNWGTYKNYDAQDFYNWFFTNRRDLIDKLNEFLESEINRQQVKFAFQQVMKLVNNADGYQKKYYYTEFIDDLNMLLGFTVKEKYYNFFYPNIYGKEAEQEEALILYDLERAREDKNYKSKIFKLEA